MAQATRCSRFSCDSLTQPETDIAHASCSKREGLLLNVAYEVVERNKKTAEILFSCYLIEKAMKRLRNSSSSLSKVFVHGRALLLMALMVSSFDTMTANAFITNQAVSSSDAVRRGHVVSSVDSKRRPTEVRMTNFFDDLKNFFDPNSSDGGSKDDSNDDDNVPAGQYRVVSISVESIKPGGLRLFLMLYLMGMQNTPDANSWRANQPSTDDYVLDFWYHDHSAILSITLSDDEDNKRITIDRVGSNPSTAYMIHESTIVQGILDELEQMATDSEVTPENRLLVISMEQPGANAIDNARDALAFG